MTDSTYYKSTIFIEIGSFNTTLQPDHTFELTFASISNDSIPIIFTLTDEGKSSIIRRFSLNDIDNKMTFIIGEK